MLKSIFSRNKGVDAEYGIPPRKMFLRRRRYHISLHSGDQLIDQVYINGEGNAWDIWFYLCRYIGYAHKDSFSATGDPELHLRGKYCLYFWQFKGRKLETCDRYLFTFCPKDIQVVFEKIKDKYSDVQNGFDLQASTS